jgi:hypothetical protein
LQSEENYWWNYRFISYLIYRFRSGHISPWFPAASSQIDQILEHESHATAQALVVAELLDILEVEVQWRETLKENNKTDA